MYTKKRYYRNKKYKSKKNLKKNKKQTKKHNRSTKKNYKKHNKKARKGGNPLDEQKSCLIHSDPGCEQVNVPYDVNCNQFYELDYKSDAIMCRNPINHNMNRSLKKNIKCKSTSLRKPKIKYCSNERNSAMKQQIGIELDEITGKIINLNNFYNTIESLVVINRNYELLLDWKQCLQNSSLVRMFKIKNVTDFKTIFEELKLLEMFLFGKEHPIQKMHWAWSRIAPLKRKVKILENKFSLSYFIFIRLGYILNLNLLELTSNYILKNKDSIPDDDVEEFRSVINPYPSEEIDYFNQFIQPEYPIVNLLINVNGDFEVKINNLEKNIQNCIKSYLESNRDETLYGYYIMIENIKNYINSKNPATIRATEKVQRQRRREDEAYRLDLDVDDLDDEEKVRAAEEKYKITFKKEQDKRNQRLYRAEQLKKIQEEEHLSRQYDQSSSADVNVNESDSDLGSQETQTQYSRGFFRQIGDTLSDAYKSRTDRLEREKEQERERNIEKQQREDDEPWVPPSERQFDFAAY